MAGKHLECIIFRKIMKNSSENIFEFLLFKRVPERGNFWQPITGALEETDKSELDGAYREIFEESGISKNQIIQVIKNVHSFVMNKHYITNKDIPEIIELVYGFEVNQDVEVNIHDNACLEHNDFKWVSFNEAMKMLKWKDNKDAFKKLYAILTKT